LFKLWEDLRVEVGKEDELGNLGDLGRFKDLANFYGGSPSVKDGSWVPDNQCGAGSDDRRRSSPLVAMAYCLSQFVYSEHSKAIFLTALDLSGTGSLGPAERLGMDTSRVLQDDGQDEEALAVEDAEAEIRKKDEILLSWAGNGLVSMCVCGRYDFLEQLRKSYLLCVCMYFFDLTSCF
jgi:hypothetical protein